MLTLELYCLRLSVNSGVIHYFRLGVNIGVIHCNCFRLAATRSFPASCKCEAHQSISYVKYLMCLIRFLNPQGIKTRSKFLICIPYLFIHNVVTHSLQSWFIIIIIYSFIYQTLQTNWNSYFLQSTCPPLIFKQSMSAKLHKISKTTIINISSF